MQKCGFYFNRTLKGIFMPIVWFLTVARPTPERLLWMKKAKFWHTISPVQPKPVRNLRITISGILKKSAIGLFECARHVVVELTHHHYDIQDIIGISVTDVWCRWCPLIVTMVNKFIRLSLWKCPRTIPVMQKYRTLFWSGNFIPATALGCTASILYSNCLWLKQNQADVYQRMDKFVFISSMITPTVKWRFQHR